MMYIDEMFQQLRDNRIMNDIDEVNKFEEALQAIMKTDDEKVIKGLCSAFDDNSEQHDVMFGLIHAVESRYDKEGISEFICCIPNMLPCAKEWVNLLLFGILNDPFSRKCLKKSLANIETDICHTVLELLKEIKESNPKQFEKAVDEVMSKINN